MRVLACVALCLFVSPVRADDKDAEKAKEVTLAFLKAVKAKDLDAVMKTVDVPFLPIDDPSKETVTKTDDLKVRMKELLEKVQPEKIPSEVARALDLPAFGKEALGKNPDAALKKDAEKALELFEKVAGKTGLVVTVLRDGKEVGAILVRLKDGQAKVVGVPK